MLLLRIFNTSISVIKHPTYVAVRTMSNASVSIKIRSGLTPSDPEQQPVLIVGQAAHLAALSWDDVRCKLEPRVSEEVRRASVVLRSDAIRPGAAAGADRRPGRSPRRAQLGRCALQAGAQGL
ncbi:hypothetical protein B5X24_HaOG204183 [Helicoverpa armigera]|uniref:Uncharacterized protein n=1 Tax=Helicoverpa armigera TaxID=29058 RepID=A0A2W1BNV5_HELAM|nr:hypothetical protein B5X24_HaOG204183 [Helicoverpa armigera]